MPERTTRQLTDTARAELADLAERYGTPLLVSAHISGAFFDPIKRPDRFGEVCMVIRRPNGKLLLTTKDFYPKGAFRLPTGGIAHSERVLDALLREAREETGLDVSVERFLAWIDYYIPALPGGAGRSGATRVTSYESAGSMFHTFAFLLAERGGTLGSLDPHERILAFREIDVGELPAVADHLDSLASELSPDIVGDWADWGKFRAVVHRAVHDALIAWAPADAARS